MMAWPLDWSAASNGTLRIAALVRMTIRLPAAGPGFAVMTVGSDSENPE
jgi:hypothetical protein